MNDIVQSIETALGLGTTPAPAAQVSRFAQCVPVTLRYEGGFVDNPKDPGGATNRGITLATLTAWRGHPVTVQDVRELSQAEAEAIYERWYWTPAGCDLLPPGVDLMVFDFGVNSGPKLAVTALQRLCGTEPDGNMGPKTAAAAAAMDRKELIARMAEARLLYLNCLTTWVSFGAGWTDRVRGIQAAAEAMG